MSTNIKISSLPIGTATTDSFLIVNNAANTQTTRVTAGAIAALAGPVSSVNGATGAVSLNATSIGAAVASHTHATTAIDGFGAAVVAIAATAAPVTSVNGMTGAVSIAAGGGDVASVNGLTGAVSLNATSVGAAPASHSHATGEITNFANAVAIIASTTGPVTSVNGLTGAVTIAAGSGAVESVNGATGAVSINATSVGAAPASHSHVTGDITDFASAVALIASTTGPVTSVNGMTGAVTIVGGTAEVESVNGLTGAVSLVAASIGAASASHATQHMRGGSDPYLLVTSSVSALTQNENNLALGEADVVRISAATTNRDITGFTGGATGVAVLLVNTGSTYVVTIKHNSTGSTESNRVLAAGATDFALSPNGGAALLVYDTAESRWRALGSEAAAGGGGDVESVNGLTGAVSLSAATIGAADATHAAQHQRGGSDAVLMVTTSLTAITQDESAYAVGDVDVAYVSAATTDRKVSGFTGGSTGAAVLVINSGATYSVTIQHAHSSASTANRVLVPWEGDYVLSPKGGAALMIYDTAESRWRVV